MTIYLMCPKLEQKTRRNLSSFQLHSIPHTYAIKKTKSKASHFSLKKKTEEKEMGMEMEGWKGWDCLEEGRKEYT